mmetsp:Transcript_44038/g.99273  ORF Transcript_44038/g.99273 Transcript_44038/m.99273 type:complete len:210 (+) Transcript_44038:1369-1998(+)
MLARRPDNTDGSAQLPTLPGVSGETPDGACLVHVARVVRVSAVVGRDVVAIDELGQSGVRIGCRGVSVAVRGLDVPVLAQLSAPRARLDSTVVGTVTGAVLADLLAGDGIRDCRSSSHNNGNTGLRRCVEEASVLALVTAHVGKASPKQERDHDGSHGEPDTELHGEAQYDKIDEPYDETENGNYDERVDRLLKVADPHPEGLCGRTGK